MPDGWCGKELASVRRSVDPPRIEMESMDPTEEFNNLLAKQVLLVSRDADCGEELKTVIEGAGVDVGNADSAVHALEILEHGAHHVVFVDSDCVGKETGRFVAQLRKRHPDRVVMVAGTKPANSLLIKLIHAGVQHFVAKPFDKKKVAGTVRAICQRREHAAAAYIAGKRPVSATPGRTNELSDEIHLANQRLKNANEILRRQVSQLTILYQMGRDISENENWSDALDRFLMALVNYAKADGASLLLFSSNQTRLTPRTNFQIEPAALERICETLLLEWGENPRGSEIHSIESYDDRIFNTCLERLNRWCMTIVPLRYRNRWWGFLLIEKPYKSSQQFRIDYPFLTTIQTILAEEVANASYISDLRQLTRFNQNVLDNINSGVITTDLDGYVLFWNHLAHEMCPKLIGGSRVHFDELFRHPDYPEGITGGVMKSNVDTHVLEVVYLGDRDNEYPARISITRMHDDNLSGMVLVGIFEDLTEQRRLEAEVRRNDRLRVLGQLSASVAHEIRNPLTGIATSAEILGNRINEENAKYVRVILDETNRLDGIIRDLLSFARPAKPQMGPCALGDLSGRVVNLVTDQATKKGVDLSVRDDLADDTCTADANQLTQVLLNLVLNAVDVCGDGDSIEISLSREDDEGLRGSGYARIDVSDSGPGVPDEIRGTLFDPFVTTKTHGTGLGLAISQQIIEEHRGDIRCEFLKSGTRFTIRLPLGITETVSRGRINRTEGKH